jgi:hypothetical protein
MDSERAHVFGRFPCGARRHPIIVGVCPDMCRGFSQVAVRPRPKGNSSAQDSDRGFGMVRACRAREALWP